MNCRQNKTHSRKQVLKYVNLVKSWSKPPWIPYQGFTLDPLGALSGPLTPRRYYAYTLICSSYAPDPFVHPNTISIYGKYDVLYQTSYWIFITSLSLWKKLPLGRQMSNWDNQTVYFSSIRDMKTFYFLFPFFHFYFSFVYWQRLCYIYLYVFLTSYSFVSVCLLFNWQMFETRDNLPPSLLCIKSTIFQLYRGGHLYWCSIIWNLRGVIYSLQHTHFRAGRRGHVGMVIGFIAIYGISAYHH